VKVYLASLGCKLNQSEIEALAREFIAVGHQVVGASDEAALCVVNTCTVTHIAARKSRQLIRRLHRANPQARIIVTGCYAEMSPEEIEGIEGVDLVVGNEDKERLVGMVGGARVPPSPTPCSPIAPAPSSRSRMAAITPAPTASSPLPGEGSAAGRQRRSWPRSGPGSPLATRKPS